MAGEPAQMTFAPISQKADVIAYFGSDGLYQFDLAIERAARIISASKDIWMYGLKWSPDRRYLAFARAPQNPKCLRSQLLVADTVSGKAKVVTSFENRISVFGWTPDSRFVTIGTEKQVLNIDASGKLKPTQLAVPQVVRECFWINSESALYLGKSAETSISQALFLWKLQTGESKKIDEGLLYDAALSPDNKRMAISHILPNGKMGLKIVDIASAAIQTVDLEG
jgi:tricorn protease-like protein